MAALLKRVLNLHWLATFLLMCASAMIVGLISLNIFMLLSANIALIAAHGAMALIDGGLLQFAELTVYGLVGVACYLLFKACEHVLVGRIFS